MEPCVGIIVLYRLSASDAEQINRRRTNSASILERMRQDPPAWPAGAQAHIGNSASEGAIVPLVVVRTWHTPGAYEPGVSCLNGQALLDGNDAFWITSAKEGTAPGTWQWPPLV